MKNLRLKMIMSLMLIAVMLFQLMPNTALAEETNALCGVWQGTYTGHSDSILIERHIRLDIDYVSGGSFEGVATIDNGVNGRYMFSGSISDDNRIEFTGSYWINNPSNFGFALFTGTFDSDLSIIQGVVNNADDRGFRVEKTADQYVSPRIEPNTLPKEWEGEYDGLHNDIVVRRMYEMHIISVSEDGSLFGKAIFAPSEDADEAYGANGSYYFSGSIDMRSGMVELQGYEWIDYPNNYSNFSFVILDGYFDFTDGACIHGYSENGIWEMTAIDYDDYDTESGFTLGIDNNSFVHTNSASWNGAGFVGATDHSMDNEYFNRLTQYSSTSERNRIKKKMHEEWHGSCYGIAMTMGLLYEDYISLSDLTDSNSANSYYSLDYPCDDDKFLNTINYFQLSQNLKNGGKISAAVSIAHNYTMFADMLNWINGYDSLSVFLKKLVNHCMNNHVEFLGFSTNSGGHAILITGCEFDEDTDTYQLKLYDENCIDSADSIGEFTYMTVAKDFSSFSFTDANGDLVNESTYVSIYFLDWDDLESIIDPMPGRSSEGMRLSFPLDASFRMENEQGQYLQCVEGKIEGDIPIISLETEDNDCCPRLIIETYNTKTLTVTNMGNVDIEAYNDDGYMSCIASSVNSAVIDIDNGISLHGDDFRFEAFVTTASYGENDKGLISLAGQASGDVVITAVESSADVFSDMPIYSIVTGSYVGVDLLSKEYAISHGNFTVNDDASIEGDVVIFGDVDRNDIVDTTDALLVLRCALHISGDPEEMMTVCDVDGNGVIDTTDALLILRMALHIG